MLCYKDMTFCDYHKDCQFGKDCFRKLTEKIIHDANAYHLPIARYNDKPDCFKELEKK